MPVDPSQIKRLHLLLNHTNLMWQKQNLISSFTNGRTEHSKEMSGTEITELIRYLEEQNKDNDKVYRNKQMDRMRKKILSYVYEMKWAKPGDWTTALKQIDEFCTGKHGMYKKALQKHSYQELVNVVTQFGNLYMKFLSK